jgi:magnesium transporter
MTTSDPRPDDVPVDDARAQALSLAFMRNHPARAARVLESLPAAQATALFQRAPARLAAAVLAAMLPAWAARCVAPLDDVRVLELLAPMGTQAAVAVLRQLPDGRRQALAGGLPAAVVLASTLLLGYAQDTLGAWADPDVVMLPATTRATEALRQVRTAAAHPLVFVTEADQRLMGLVPLTRLLQAPDAATLATLMQRPPTTLAAHAPLAATAGHPGWAESSMLPVVAPGDRLLGVMTHDALQRALRQAGPTATDGDGPAEQPLAVALVHGYWQALSGVMALALGLLPRVPPAMAGALARPTPAMTPLAPISPMTPAQPARRATDGG